MDLCLNLDKTSTKGICCGNKARHGTLFPLCILEKITESYWSMELVMWRKHNDYMLSLPCFKHTGIDPMRGGATTMAVVFSLQVKTIEYTKISFSTLNKCTSSAMGQLYYNTWRALNAITITNKSLSSHVT